MKKLLAMIALSGVLSASALALTVQAAVRSTACCEAPDVVDFSIKDYEYYNQNDHNVWLLSGTWCKNCTTFDELSRVWMGCEEHDYDIYDSGNRRRYCKCGDFFVW